MKLKVKLADGTAQELPVSEAIEKLKQGATLLDESADAQKAEAQTADAQEDADEKDAEDKPLAEQRAEALGSDAEVAALYAIVGRYQQAIDALPDKIAAEVKALGEKLSKRPADETRHLRALFGGAFGDSPSVQSAITGIDENAPIGTGKFTRKQAGLWLQGVLALASKRPIPQEVESDDLVKQALYEGTGSQGGYLVPADEQIEIIRAVANLVEVWPLLDVRTTTSNIVRRPVRSSYGAANTGTNAADEGGAVSEVSITWAQQTWTLRAVDAYYPCSFELLNDSPANVLAEVQAAAAEAFADAREMLPLLGRGGTTYEEPLGVFHDSSISDVDVSGALDIDGFLDVVQEIPKKYRNNATALMATSGAFAIAVDLAKNYRNIDLLNLPRFLEAEHVPEGRLVVGDFKRYRVYINPRMELVTETDATHKLVKMVFWERWDGHATITDAFRTASGITYS